MGMHRPSGQPDAVASANASGTASAEDPPPDQDQAAEVCEPGTHPRHAEPASLTDELTIRQDRDQFINDPGAVQAEWALWGKEANESEYHVLRCSEGVFGMDDFREIITRYASGVKDRLPQYTVCWIPEGNGRDRYLAVGIHELADAHPSRSGGRSRTAGGREIEYVRLFCVRYAELTSRAVAYTEFVDAVRQYLLPAGPTKPVELEIPTVNRPHDVSAQRRRMAEHVMMQLLTTRPVCVLGAEETSAEDRLLFIDLVMSLLPYGLRATLSASTWASSTAKDLKLRLFFSNATRDDGGRTTYVAWGQPEPPSITAEHEAALLHLSWLRQVGPRAAATLAREVEPVMFTASDIRRKVPTLRDAGSLEETLEELARGLRVDDHSAVRDAIGWLKLYLNMSSPITRADRAICLQVIAKRGLLQDHPRLDPSTKETVYSVLITLAFPVPLTYESYCAIESLSGDRPHGALRIQMIALGLSDYLPWILTMKAAPQSDDAQLTESLHNQHMHPRTPLDQVERSIGSWRIQDRAPAYDFAVRYLRRYDPAAREVLARRGYLALVLELAFPEDQRQQRIRLEDILRFVYGGLMSQAQIEELFAQPDLRPTRALEESVRRMASSSKSGPLIAERAAVARISSAGLGQEVALIQNNVRRRRKPRWRRRPRWRLRLPAADAATGTIWAIPKGTFFLLIGLIVIGILFLAALFSALANGHV